VEVAESANPPVCRIMDYGMNQTRPTPQGSPHRGRPMPAARHRREARPDGAARFDETDPHKSR
ncbi:MAG: hypothetical protein OXG71_03900, partial [Rhodospirillales bacterium]|nr:hypothetical protein [Rhodospirillales bacterium]